MSMRIAAAQIVTGEDPHANLRLVEAWTEKAAKAGARVVVFPEATQRAFGYPLAPIAEPLNGPWANSVREIADIHHVTIVVGMFTPASPNEAGAPRVANTLLAVGGGVDTSYDKIHLYDAFGFHESDSVAPGNRLAHFTVDGVRFGLATCYDIRFPQLFVAQAQAGAAATLVSASWGAGPGKVDQWELLARARALDSTQYVVACGQGLPTVAGIEAVAGAPTGVGHSMIVSPTGKVLQKASDAPELLFADIDLDAVDRAHSLLPVLKNSRTIS